jgi:hypothetical protein
MQKRVLYPLFDANLINPVRPGRAIKPQNPALRILAPVYDRIRGRTCPPVEVQYLWVLNDARRLAIVNRN